jgi:histidine triad (HIT) family protein
MADSQSSQSSQPAQKSQQASMQEIISKQKEQCVFCKIVAGEIPSTKVYEDDKVIAVMDINPAADGHVLLMPKEHYPLLPWVPRDVFRHLFKTSKYLGRAIEDAFGVKADIFIANGGVAGQQSTHFMIHVLPAVKAINAEGKAEVEDNFVAQIKAVLSQNIGLALQKVVEQDPIEAKFLAIKEEQKDTIIKLFNSNPEFRDLILNNPELVKQKIETDPNFKELFKGINVDALSLKLKDMVSKK